jgi:hypothetical protein
LFDLEVTYPAIEPPNYLMALHPDVYQAEQARVRERFESAVELAEQAFATELQRLTAHLAERLTGLHDGRPKVFRDSAASASSPLLAPLSPKMPGNLVAKAFDGLRKRSAIRQ